MLSGHTIPVVEKLPFTFKSWIKKTSISISKARNSFALTQVMKLYSNFFAHRTAMALLEKITEGERGVEGVEENGMEGNGNGPLMVEIK